MFSFKIFNIRVRVEWWFWRTLAFIGGGLTANDADSIMRVLLFMGAGFLSILIHELGHALMIRRYGYQTEIVLIAFGGYATCPVGAFTRKQDFLVTLAGPLVQFAAGVGVWFLLQSGIAGSSSQLLHLLNSFFLVSIVWAIFNCFPIMPMDGGKMLLALVGPRFEKAVYITGIVCALTLGFLGLAYLKTFLLPIFMGLFAYQNWQLLQQAGSGRRFS